MKTTLFPKWAICVLPIILGASLGLMSTQAADREIIEPGIAAGAAEDTLKACIARIPKDASIGQLMIAEQGCWRDENDRNPLKVIPDARSAAVIDPAERGVLAKSGNRTSKPAPNDSK